MCLPSPLTSRENMHQSTFSTGRWFHLPSPLTSRVNALESISNTGRCAYLLSLLGWRYFSLFSVLGEGFTYLLQWPPKQMLSSQFSVLWVKTLKSILSPGRCTYLLCWPPGWRHSSLFPGLGDALIFSAHLQGEGTLVYFQDWKMGDGLTFSAHQQGEGTRVYFQDWEMHLPSLLTSRVKALESIFRTGRCTYFSAHLQREGDSVYS